MKVSVIIPAWGRTPYLNEAMAALSVQTFRDFEIICCQPPANAQNAGAARNEGLSQATGDWIMFLDADDRYSENGVEKLVRAADRYKADIVSGGLVKTRNSKKIAHHGKQIPPTQRYNKDCFDFFTYI